MMLVRRQGLFMQHHEEETVMQFLQFRDLPFTRDSRRHTVLQDCSERSDAHIDPQSLAQGLPVYVHNPLSPILN